MYAALPLSLELLLNNPISEKLLVVATEFPGTAFLDCS
jgi:hypothetical protein